MMSVGDDVVAFSERIYDPLLLTLPVHTWNHHLITSLSF